MIVAVFGGSFNPPHVAHVLAATLVLSTEAVDRLLVVPAFQHPFAKALAPFEDRARMCELAMGWLPRVDVSRVEEELGGESKTLRTLEHLAAANPSWQLRLVIGADILSEAPRWFGFEAIKKLAPLIVLGRAGAAQSPGPLASREPLLPAISSTEVRTWIAEERWAELAPLVPRAVLDYVRARGLYRPEQA